MAAPIGIGRKSAPARNWQRGLPDGASANAMAEHNTELTWGPTPDGDDPLEGTPYGVVGHIATGGMGEVYLADHRSVRGRYVVKLLHAKMVSDARLVDRMRVEAQALSVLRHQSIVHVFDSGTTPTGRPYIVMERLQGNTLADELRQRGPLRVSEALTWVRQLLSALQAAHDIGVVHRDVKLSNLFLHEPPDQPRRLKVLDFGIAKVLEGASDKAPQPLHQPTEVGIVIGTPAYVSPEAVLGKPIDHRADIYAAGIVLYILLCGRGPWDHERRELNSLAARVHESPRPPSAYAPRRLPPDVDAAVMKALARAPDDRFQSAREFEAALERAAASAVEAAGELSHAALHERPKETTASLESGARVKSVHTPRERPLGNHPAFDATDPALEADNTLFPGQTRPELALTEALAQASVVGMGGHTEILPADPLLDRSAQDAQPTRTSVRAGPLNHALSQDGIAPEAKSSGLIQFIGSPAMRIAATALLFGVLAWWLLNLWWP
jgi:eukaryotic-like serine/threonine-protein kinase